MRRRLLAAIGACGIAAASGALAGPPPTPQALVAQLASDDYSEREAALKALDALGAAALPALQVAAKSDDITVRRAAGPLVAKLERAAESATRLAAKSVSLSLKDVPLGSAVNTLKARTGINVVLDANRVADPLRCVTVETAEVPVWEALEAFCKAAGLREAFSAELEVPKQERRGRGYYTPPPPPPTADAVPITLVDGKPESLPGTRSTAVRVLALPGGYPGNRAILGSGEFTLNLDVAPLPGLGWSEVAGVKLTRVIDDMGRVGCAGTPRDTSPADADPFGGMVFLGNGRVVAMRWDFEGNMIPPGWHPNPRAVPVLLKVPTRDARSLKLLEGVVLGEVSVPNQQLIVAENPSKLVGTQLTGPGGVKLTIQDVKVVANGATAVRVVMESPTAGGRRRGFAVNLGWQDPLRPVQGNHIRAYDDKGNALTPAGTGHTDSNDDGSVLITTHTFTFPAAKGTPAKLVVVGAKQVAVEVPFRMENVQLP